MNITDKILSIPPYISSSWKNIASLYVESRPFGHVLIIDLISGTKVEIPNLNRPLIEQIFAFHAKVVENEEKDKNSSLMTAAIPFPFTFPNLEGLTSMIQHSEEQKNSPLLPSEMLERISQMTKGLLPEDISSIQQPEPDCNCPHCQIMRAVLGSPAEPISIEEEVTDEDLKFRTWDIKQENNKLYTVTNPLEHKEHYNVFLGDPLCCSCGNNACVHIEAVLKS